MFRASRDSIVVDLFINIEQLLSRLRLEELNDPDAWHNILLD